MLQLIKPYHKELKESFDSGITRPASWRKQQLGQLFKGIKENKAQMEEAMMQDMGRNKFFTEFAELSSVMDYCNHHIDNVDQYMQEIEVDPPLVLAPATSTLRYEPLGVALIMGSWNFPFFVTLKPLVSCITAGNCAIIKPSELGPCSAQVIQVIIEKYLDPKCFKVIQGEADVSIELTQQKFDVICFTGSTDKGKLVAKAAAANLVPCILELGGKCPFICDESTDLDYQAMKICFAKFQNAGQTCIGVDYVLVPENDHLLLIKNIIKQLKKQYGINPSDPNTQKYNPHVGKLINDMSVDRISSIIKDSGGQVLVGGLKHIDAEERYVSPTVILNPSLESQLMKNEIFGPVLPIITYKNFDEMVEKFLRGKEKPLAIYYGGNSSSENFKKICDESSSGNVSANDVLTHSAEIELGFGGVGNSGYGRVGGWEGFKSMSNCKSITTKYQCNIWPYNWICPPYTSQKIKILRFLQGLWHIKQNSFSRGLVRLISIILLYLICFGKLGQSRFRKEIAGKLIEFLKTYQ